MSNYRIRCQDNLDFMAPIKGGEVTLIVTSPPYNIGKKYEQKTTLDDYLKQQRKVIKECVRILKNDGSICWQVGNYIDNGEIYPLDIYFYRIFKKLGCQLRNRIIWHFGHGLHCTKRLSGRYETIMWFTKSDDYFFNLDPIRVPSKYPNKRYYKGPNKGKLSGNPLGKNPSDIWDIGNIKNNHPEKTSHPCQFPLELVDRLIKSMTKEGDIVFDPYLGSGTTVVSALQNNRVGWGCDIMPSYTNIAKLRVKTLLKGYNDEKKWSVQKKT